MNSDDKARFLTGIANAFKFYRVEFTDFAGEVWLKVAEGSGVDAVLAAVNAHMVEPKVGRFLPTPADVVGRIKSKPDGRPEADEAWALLPIDDNQSAIWTNEMSIAFGIAYDLIKVGDMIAARMAFKSAYTRLVNEARDAGKPPRWVATLGEDVAGREAVVKAALEAGRISEAQAIEWAPSLRVPSAAAALAAPEPEQETPVARECRTKLRELVAQQRVGIKGREWATLLAKRKDLTPAQREMVDDALAPAQTRRHTNIELIPDNKLPPAMREHP